MKKVNYDQRAPPSSLKAAFLFQTKGEEKMIKDILKQSTAGLLSALTLLTTVPLSGAVDGGIMPLAEEDNEASSI